MKFKSTLSFLIKIGIVIFSLYFLYNELVLKNNIINFDKNLFFKLIVENILSIVIVLFLMFLNWFLEALKWQYMISKIEKITIYTSLKAVFAGITVSSLFKYLPQKYRTVIINSSNNNNNNNKQRQHQ